MYGLSPRVTLEGFSRGGLFAYNWAADHPDKVACIYDVRPEMPDYGKECWTNGD